MCKHTLGWDITYVTASSQNSAMHHDEVTPLQMLFMALVHPNSPPCAFFIFDVYIQPVFSTRNNIPKQQNKMQILFSLGWQLRPVLKITAGSYSEPKITERSVNFFVPSMIRIEIMIPSFDPSFFVALPLDILLQSLCLAWP